MKAREIGILLLLSLGALFVHGYHPGAEDAEIYLPGVEKILHPELFPFNAQFFESHAHLTLFPNLIAASVRVTHLPLEWTLFLWQMAAIFLLLLACWKLSAVCSANLTARWAGVALVAALFTIPIAGTALYIMDQYINPRNLVAFAAIFAVVKVLDKKYVQAGLFLAFAAVIHPLMSVFVLSFCVLLVAMQKFDVQFVRLAALLPFGLSFDPPSAAYHQVALSHPYFFLTRWEWYEWLGVAAPLVILWAFSRIAQARNLPEMQLVCRALIVYQIIYVVAALALDIPARFESLARLQPMRSLYLLYVLLFLFSGVLLGEYALKNHIWRWLLLFVPLSAGMFFVQRELFPASAHIERPGAAPKNLWAQAFSWVRDNTPQDAIFALDPLHMSIAGEDENGFRAIAQRSMLADAVKDSGAVTMFPPLADEWAQQVQAQSGWNNFGMQDFRRLEAQYHINWVVLRQPGIAGLECPYQNRAVRVCRLD